MESDFDTIFQKLKNIILRNAGSLSVSVDTDKCLCLEGGVHPRTKKPFPMVWAEINKSYVSFHLMPIYGNPVLLNQVSSELKTKMQGKSCFNFQKINERLFQELEQLTRLSMNEWRQTHP